MRRASEEGPQVITQNGIPTAYLVPASTSGIEADLDSLRRLLRLRALDKLQADAARSGTSELSMEDINAEIAATRRERNTRKRRTPKS